jgi:hypothetical protein
MDSNDEAPVPTGSGPSANDDDEARMVRAGLALDEDENGGTRFGTSGTCGSMSLRNDLPRDVALREEAKAFALQNRCGAL